ncbi:MAG: type II toxin-antitoxin system CcdA family antitoxin, partial [Candidatus Bathyarchaeota archaeon]|nr:type II toxin-antitoxin system CcdA family antitoxin [Candidatus Bathyarchaeota archaeon]
MKKKMRTTLYLNKEVVNKAKELGFNISKLCENCLKQSIAKMEGFILHNNSGFSVNAFPKR